MAKIITTNGKGTYQIITWFGTKVKVKYTGLYGNVYIRPLLLYSIRDCWRVISLLSWFQSTIKAESLYKEKITHSFDPYG